MRVLRKNADAGSFAGAIIAYDGLYSVVACCKSKGRGGHVVWRYLLRRRPGQPESVCKPVRRGGCFLASALLFVRWIAPNHSAAQPDGCSHP